MYQTCVIIRLFLINLVCGVVPALGEYCYYYYYYTGSLYRRYGYICDTSTSGGTVAGGVVGAIIFVAFVTAVIICICHSKHKRTMTVRTMQPAVATVHQSYQSQTMYNQYPQPGMHQQNMAYPPPPQGYYGPQY